MPSRLQVQFDTTFALYPHMVSSQQSLVVVVPFYNEEANILLFFQRLLGGLGGYLKAVVAVDDGSTDQTVTLLEKVILESPVPVHLVRLSRNFGHQPAVIAGCEHACHIAEELGAQWIGVIDGDLQDRPEDFLELLRCSTNHDVVYAVRAQRHDGLIMRLCAPRFYGLLSHTSSFPIPQNAGTFSVIRIPVCKQIVEAAGIDPYFPGLRAWVGFRQRGVLFDRQPRAGGQSKVAVKGLIRLSMRAFILYSDMPARAVLGATGFLFLVLALIAAGVLALRIAGVILPTGVTTIILLQIFSLGLCAGFFSVLTLIVGRIKTNTSQQGRYVIMEIKTKAGDSVN